MLQERGTDALLWGHRERAAKEVPRGVTLRSPERGTPCRGRESIPEEAGPWHV